MNDRIKTLVLVLCSLLFTVLITVGGDRIIGHFRVHGDDQNGLVFPPSSRIILRTSEFDSVAVVNSLGFRDREFSVHRNAQYRILALGDSFTFGWGLNIEDTWVKQLEEHLRQRGHKVEIADLGRGGDYPKDYADVAEKAIPLLKPDLVLIAVLQGDDLVQERADIAVPQGDNLAQGQADAKSQQADSRQLNAARVREAISRTVRGLYPNLMDLLRPVVAYLAPEVQTGEWRKETTEILAKVDDPGKAKVNSLDTTVKHLYLEGNLNPGLLDLAIHEPDHMAATMELGNPATGSLISAMGNHLLRIRKVAARHGARVMVVSVPYRAYVNRSDWDQLKRLGFVVTEDMLTSTAPDDAIHFACYRAGLQFYSVTDGFRRAVKGRHLYFEFDGHFNREGSLLFSDLLVPLIEDNALAGR